MVVLVWVGKCGSMYLVILWKVLVNGCLLWWNCRLMWLMLVVCRVFSLYSRVLWLLCRLKC